MDLDEKSPDQPAGRPAPLSANEAEARATFARPPTVARLRSARRTANFDTVGGAALLVAFGWPVVQAIATASVGGLFWGLLGGVIFFLGAALGAGLVEAAWSGARATSLAFAVVSLGASFFWHRTLPTWAFATLAATAAVGLVMTWRLESSRLRAGTELDGAIVDALMALPEGLPRALQANVDEALGVHQQVVRSLTTLEGLVDRAPIAAIAHRALTALIRQTRRQAELEAALSQEGSATLVSLKDEGRARLVEITYEIKALRDAIYALWVRRDGHLTAELASRIEQLRLTAQALDELDAG